MGLSVALNAARGSLQATAVQTDVVSRNIAGVNDPSYSRKITSLVTTDGPVRVVITRASSTFLFDRMVGSTSELASRQAVLDGLTSLEDTVGDTEAGRSISAKISALNVALGDAANKPDDINLAKGAVAAAKDLARSLNRASSTVQSTRARADEEIDNSVKTINDLLAQFDKANKEVVLGTARKVDISDALDRRDKILAQLSKEIGISTAGRVRRDVWFAVGIIAILAVLFLPVPAVLIDIGLALSIALAVLILMVALWIQKPLEFSSFPTILLIATLLRLALGIATTRLILSNGDAGVDAAGHVIQGFSQFVMSGDFVIGLVVFAILITVNFLVITKGATRIAEVGARFTLDAIPGKQMAIDADLSAGLIDDKEAQRRRRELEEESAFFGSMDGASKFVRGEAVASLIVIVVNIFGGIVIGVTRHGLPLAKAADVFTKLSVGDGLVSQIPALIVSLAAGLLVSKGGTRGTAEQAILGQLGAYPRALFVAAGLMAVFAIMPGMPFVPFAILSLLMASVAYLIPRRLAEAQSKVEAATQARERQLLLERQDSEAVRESLKTAEIELRLGKHLAVQMQPAQQELAHRVGRMRRKFAQQYGFVVPDIKLVESAAVPSKSYEIAIHGTVIAAQQVRPGEMMIVVGDGPMPGLTGEEVREPAFGMRAVWVPDTYAQEARREGFSPIDWHSVMLTHVSEVIRNNLPQLLSYKDLRMLIDRLDGEYKRLVDEICPSQISYSGLQAVLKLLLAERVSIRNLHLIIEAIAEIVPHARRAEQIAEHVRLRIAQQICGDLAENGVLSVLRLGSRWDLTFHQGLKRDGKGDVVEVDIDPRLIEQFGVEASEAIRAQMKTAHKFALVTAPEVRSYVRMIIERLFPTVAVLSHVEIARGVEIRSLGTIS